MYTNATYWTLWYPPSYGKIWIGKFVIAQRIGRCGILFLMARFELANLSSTRRSWRCSFLPFLLSSNSIHTRLFKISHLKTAIWIARILSNYKKTKDEKSRTSFRSRTTGSNLSIAHPPTHPGESFRAFIAFVRQWHTGISSPLPTFFLLYAVISTRDPWVLAAHPSPTITMFYSPETGKQLFWQAAARYKSASWPSFYTNT